MSKIKGYRETHYMSSMTKPVTSQAEVIIVITNV